MKSRRKGDVSCLCWWGAGTCAAGACCCCCGAEVGSVEEEEEGGGAWEKWEWVDWEGPVRLGDERRASISIVLFPLGVDLDVVVSCVEREGSDFDLGFFVRDSREWEPV